MTDFGRVLITGASGFVGTYLVGHLQSLGCELAGYDLLPGRVGDRITFYRGDIHQGKELSAAITDFRPDMIFHLAGVLKSDEPGTFYKVHVLGTTALFDAIVSAGLQTRVLVASSSAVYGGAASGRSITESFRARPANHYAVSKLAQEMVALQYYRSLGVPVMCTRTFNLIGPGLSTEMAPSSFAQQIAQAERNGGSARIFTGDLAPRRDYVDVRDAVRAYVLIAEHGKAGQIYNVCSGKASSIRECLQVLLDQARIPIEPVVDPALIQKNDVPLQIGSAKKLRAATGWKAAIPLKQSLLDLLDDWRKKAELEKS